MAHLESNDSQGVGRSLERETVLNQFVLTQSINDAKSGGRSTRPDAAPDSLGQRLVDVTVDGISKVPEGIRNSLNVNDILPNVAVGFGIGFGAKALLPAAGPVGKVIAGAGGLYFVGKPLVESYGMAAMAQTKGDMENAGTHFGNSIGAMPIAIVEGGVGAKLGTMTAGRMLGRVAAVSTPSAVPERLPGKIASEPELSYGRDTPWRNEHMSDVAEALLGKTTLPKTDGAGWIVGKELFNGQPSTPSLRTMQRPGTAYWDGKNPPPDQFMKLLKDGK